MEYKPTSEDIVFAKQVNDEIIWTQVLNPNALKAAYKRLFGEDAFTAQQAKIKIFAWFQYTFKPEMIETHVEKVYKDLELRDSIENFVASVSTDKTETANIESPSVTIDNQSHSEDNNKEVKPKRKRNARQR